MSIYYSFTIPPEKERLNDEIFKYIINHKAYDEHGETKDGFWYSLEFKSEGDKEQFKKEMTEKFPYIY
jgi:hypothetical protein